MNKCIFIGNVTKDVESAATPNGVAVCKFTIAVNRKFTNQDGNRECDFINIVTWRGLAENCGKYLSKGSKVCVCGQLQARSYDDKDGNKRYVTEIVAEDVEFLSSRNTDAEEPKKETKSKIDTTQMSLADNDLPF